MFRTIFLQGLSTLLFGLFLFQAITPLSPGTQMGYDHCYAASECEGDFDGDQDVDGSDLSVFAADFGRIDYDQGDFCAADFNGDNDVDGSDLAIFAADFGQTNCPRMCPSRPYSLYFWRCPTIAQASIDKFDQETLDLFCTYIEQLETIGKITIDEPLQLQNCNEPDSCRYIFLTDTEMRRIHAAKAAHSIWLDKNGILPWKLDDYSETELAGLFDKDSLFDYYNAHWYFYSVVDHSPSDVYGYAENYNLIGEDILSTIHSVLSDLRTTDTKKGFRHGVKSRDPIDTAYSLYDALTTYSGEFRVSRAGCHSMSRIVLGLLRSLNIPGQEADRGEWFAYGHSSVVWPAMELVMPHGDDIYNAGLWAAPVWEFLVPFPFYDESQNIAVCGTDKDCLSMRHRSLLAVRYLSSYTVERCCNPGKYGYVSCSDYLNSAYGTYLTPEEMENAIVRIELLSPCNNIDVYVVPAITDSKILPDSNIASSFILKTINQ